MLNDNIIIEL